MMINKWIIGTLYRNPNEHQKILYIILGCIGAGLGAVGFVAGRGITWKTKTRIMITATLLMSVGFIMMRMKGIMVDRIVFSCVWLFHILYFCFGGKTIPTKNTEIQ